jgi:hypothetical protein
MQFVSSEPPKMTKHKGLWTLVKPAASHNKVSSQLSIPNPIQEQDKSNAFPEYYHTEIN